MIHARARISLAGFCVVALLPLVSRGAILEAQTSGVGRIVDDTARIIAYFKDTTVVAVSPSRARRFDLRTPARRESLHAVLRRERARWRAKRPRDYRFLLHVSCFCPGVRGWLLMDVRKNQPLRAWDTSGKTVPISEWNMFSIDGLFDDEERSIDRVGLVEIAFDPRWHFPAYVRSVALPGPDAWSIIDARALRPQTP